MTLSSASSTLHILRSALTTFSYSWRRRTRTHLTSVTVLFITAIHTVVNSIAQPSNWDTAGFVSASKLIFLTFSHTVHLFKYKWALRFLLMITIQSQAKGTCG